MPFTGSGGSLLPQRKAPACGSSRKFSGSHSMGLKQRQIAGSCAIAQSTVHEYLKAAAQAGVSWPLPAEWKRLSSSGMREARCREVSEFGRQSISPHLIRHYAGFRTIPGEASSGCRSACQCWGEARSVVPSPGIVLITDL